MAANLATVDDRMLARVEEAGAVCDDGIIFRGLAANPGWLPCRSSTQR
jgi:hypothetical protein